MQTPWNNTKAFKHSTFYPATDKDKNCEINNWTVRKWLHICYVWVFLGNSYGWLSAWIWTLRHVILYQLMESTPLLNRITMNWEFSPHLLSLVKCLNYCLQTIHTIIIFSWTRASCFNLWFLLQIWYASTWTLALHMLCYL